MGRVSPPTVLSGMVVDFIDRVPLGLSIRELMCRVGGLYAHWCHRSKVALFPVAVSGVVFPRTFVLRLCFLSGREYYVLPRRSESRAATLCLRINDVTALTR
jgi:hypothetical protein